MKNSTLFTKILFRPLALICCLTPLQSNAQIVVGSNGPNETISTAFTGAQTLTKVGGNVVTLTGNSTYSGGTWLTSGALIFVNGNNFGTGALTIASPNTFLSNSTSVTLANNLVFSNFNGLFDMRLPNNSSLVLNGTISGGAGNTLWRFSGGEGGQNTGALTLNGINTFAGKLEVFRGPLILGNSQAAGTALIVLDSNRNPNGSLQFSSSFSISNNIQTKTAGEPIGVASGRSNNITGVIFGAGGINKVGAGSLYLSGANTYSGTTVISAGALFVGDGGTRGTLGTGSVNNNAALVLNRSDLFSISNAISGSGSLTKQGSGTATLRGANTYSGFTEVYGGTLAAAVDNAFSSDSGIYLDGGTIDIGATMQAAPSLTIVRGTHTQTNGSLTITDLYTDSLQIASEAGESATYNLSGGTLTTDNQANLQIGLLGDGTLNQSGGNLDITGYFVLGRWEGSRGTYNLTNGVGNQSAEDRFTIIGEDGTGEMTVGGSGVFNAVSTIQLGLGDGSGTLRITDGGTVNTPGINLGWRDANNLVFDISSTFGSTNFSVPITGAGSLVKAGTGTVVFDQNNSYGGTTTISNGTLAVNGIHSSAGTYTVQTNAVLAGTGEIEGFVIVQDGGTINPGIGGNNEEFKIGGLEIQSGGILNVVLGGATTSQLQVAGGVNLGATSVVNFSTNAPLNDALYPFLTYGGAISGTFGVTNNVPPGYEVIHDADDKLVALLFSATNYAVAPVFNGENAVITGGTLPFNVFIYNNTVTNVAVTSSGGTSTTGTASTNIPSETSDSLSGLAWTGTTVGLNQAGNFTNVFAPSTGPVVTNTVNVNVSVYDHASNVTTGSNLTFAPVHAGNPNPVAATNSITVSNLGTGGPRVALGMTNINTNSAVSLDDVRNLAQGDSIEINGLLDSSLMGLGRFTNTVQLVAFDDSALNGAITLNTNAITVTGYVYSGQGVWNTPGGGNWSNIAQWQVPGGTPGLDGEYSVNDTALFGANGNGTVTNNGSVQMLSITFSNTDAYTIDGTGTITLTSAGGNAAAINTAAGSHIVDNKLELGSDVVISNAADTLLTLNKPVDGGFGLIKEGEGTTTLGAANTYTGGTTVNGGLLNIDSARGLANDAGNALVINEGVVSLNNNDVFGQHYGAINTPVVINEGGTLQSSGAYYNPLGPVYLNGGSIVATDVEPTGGYSFSFKGDVIVDGNATSTIDGPGFALGADDVDFTRFEVADNSTLDVIGILVDGPSANYAISQASRLVKDGGGRMLVSGNNTYSGGTVLNGGTLATGSSSALGSGPVELLGGTLEINSVLNIESLLWESTAKIAIPNSSAGHFVNVSTPIAVEGVNYFNLAGPAPTGPVKLLAAPSLTANDISLFGFEGLDPDAYLLEYGEDGALYLVLIPQPAPVPVPEPEKSRYPDFTQFAGNPNQMQVAQALNRWAASNPSGDRAEVLDALVASGDYQKGFEAMMPSQYASLPNMAFNQANALNSGMFQRLWVVRVNGQGFSSTLSPAPLQGEMGGVDDMEAFAIRPSRDTKWGTFVDGNGIFADGGDVANLQNYRSQSGGVSAGASYKWTDNLATGVYVGYQGLQAQYDNGQTIDNAVRFGVFGTYEIGGLYFNALVGGAYHDYSVERDIEFGSIDRTARGRPVAGEFDLAIGTGYDFKAGDFTFGPFTTMQYTYLGVQGFEETGADSLNLDVDPYNSSSLLYTLGAQVGYNLKVSSSVLITPTLFAGWQHEFLQDGYQINSSFNTGGPASPFSYNTGTPARDNFYGGVGVTVGIGERWQATAIYSSFVGGDNQNSQNVYLGLGLNF
ncbi:MAG: autotransporter domain-containing protein [Akkermansiaceae bacterium]